MSDRRLRSTKLLASLMVAASAVALMAAPAVAQQADDTSRLDTVIITATQREENLQKVAVSAVAMPEEQVAAVFAAGEDVIALAARVPALYAESSNGRVAPRFYIRGLGNTDFDLAASQPVSIIMDDVVMENVVLKSFPIFDMDRVEVYRGPQGTLFGRNTTAGIVRFTSKKPTEEFDYNAQATVGSYGTKTFEGGMGGQIVDGVRVRGSMLYQHRDDWIDNTLVPGDDNLGGFDELAGRLQVALKPTEALDILLNVHGRDLDGTAAVFRANVLGPNGLNANYDRDRVTYNQGGGNPQSYNAWGGSANVGYDFGDIKLTSITGYESANGYSRGDIDGGVAGVGPGFIPFDSDTQDSIDKLGQFTQEVRFASDVAGPLQWQTGVYYFDSAFTVTTVGPSGFPPPATLKHENTSWAVFGQLSYDLTDALTLTGGLRYTDDEKKLTVAAAPVNNRKISDDHVSWDLSAMYDITPDFAVYARVADGFRGPSIQGRDIAFFNPPSLAQSETVMSYEAGFKSTLFDSLRLNAAAFTYEVSDIQLTAVGGGGNLVQLINANKGKASGFEVDAEWAPIDNLTFTAGYSYVDSEIDDNTLAVGICAQCTVTDPTVLVGTPPTLRALVDGNPFPNAPESIANFTARYSIPLGNGGELFAFTDWAFQGKTNLFIYESREFQTKDQFEGGLKVGWTNTEGTLEVAAFARNITDEDNVKGAIDFNNNTAFVNEPRIIGISARISN
ncbi:MAG TPA: TonB-dependent receptor [Hyphomonadaceae bacterium]|nr:TonB-dependent receptor [Hyphomonadaceae bacterium]HPN05695.1 TonB-dependent receptor [Hyphomonadaceae bacterium]